MLVAKPQSQIHIHICWWSSTGFTAPYKILWWLWWNETKPRQHDCLVEDLFFDRSTNTHDVRTLLPHDLADLIIDPSNFVLQANIKHTQSLSQLEEETRKYTFILHCARQKKLEQVPARRNKKQAKQKSPTLWVGFSYHRRNLLHYYYYYYGRRLRRSLSSGGFRGAKGALTPLVLYNPI